MKYGKYIHTVIGIIYLESEFDAVTKLQYADEVRPAESCPLLDVAERQLREYLAGVRRAFDLPLDPGGTPFQRQVWAALREIPYGETRSYKNIALRVGKPGGTQAVGNANHRNPIAIVIPCHRVIGANGALVGYGGGVDRQAFLLRLEGVHI